MIGYGRADTHHAWDGVRPEMSMGARAFKRCRGTRLEMIRVAWAKLHRVRVWQAIRVVDSGSFRAVREGWGGVARKPQGGDVADATNKTSRSTTPAEAGVQLERSM